jgi:hypothetical protein
MLRALDIDAQRVDARAIACDHVASDDEQCVEREHGRVLPEDRFWPGLVFKRRCLDAVVSLRT